MVVDYYSHWIEAILLKKTDTHHVVKSMEAIFRTHGLPECVRSDNGPPFASEQFRTFLEYFGIQRKKDVPYWPQSNGEVERCNETLLKIVGIRERLAEGSPGLSVLVLSYPTHCNRHIACRTVNGKEMT